MGKHTVETIWGEMQGVSPSIAEITPSHLNVSMSQGTAAATDRAGRCKESPLSKVRSLEAVFLKMLFTPLSWLCAPDSLRPAVTEVDVNFS